MLRSTAIDPAVPATRSLSVPFAARLWPAVGAALLGLTLLFGVGLAQPQVLHNATHDTRHATGFPCH